MDTTSYLLLPIYCNRKQQFCKEFVTQMSCMPDENGVMSPCLSEIFYQGTLLSSVDEEPGSPDMLGSFGPPPTVWISVLSGLF
jgi:hypothetical protein